jgi:hypothetical protein
MKNRSSMLASAVLALLFVHLATFAAPAVAATGPNPFWQWLNLSPRRGSAREGRMYQSGDRYYEPCPPTQSWTEQPSPDQTGETARPGEMPGTQPSGEKTPGTATTGDSNLPSSDALASNYGASSGPLSSAPNMIGDQFGGRMGASRIIRHFNFPNLQSASAPNSNFYTITANPTPGGTPSGTPVALNQEVISPPVQNFVLLDYNDKSGRLGGVPLNEVPAGGSLVRGTTIDTGDSIFTSEFDVAYDLNIPSPSGGVVGRMKIADDTSPMPRDRLIFDYDYFDGVPLFPGGVNVSRFTPGFEKTFFDGWMSFEMKFPMATTLDSTIVQDGVTNTSNGEFGNMLLTWKTLLILREKWAISGGLSVAPPTADDVRVVTADGTPLVQVQNRATHLGPFVGLLWTPNDRWFAQGFLQYDVGANGNPVLINENQLSAAPRLTNIGTLVDTPFQYVDIGLGYWAYRGHERFRRLTGWAFTGELHWNHSLQAADTVTAGDWRIGDFASTIESLNLTLGTHLEFFDRTTVTVGYSVPLGGGLDREFNGELRVMLNRRFGPQNRLTQSTF